MPEADTEKEEAVPTTKVAVFGDVMVGAWSTVSTKLWFTDDAVFVAVKVMGYVPPVPVPGVPAKAPELLEKVTPEGNAPDSLNVGVGDPVAVTANEPAIPTVNVAFFAEVNTGAVGAEVLATIVRATENVPFEPLSKTAKA
jgi:hypothetical protein